MTHQCGQCGKLFLTVQKFGVADAGDGGKEVAAPAGCVVFVECTAAVHFKGNDRIFAQNVELAPLAGAVAEKRKCAAFTGVAKIQRQKIRLTIVYHGKMNYFTIIDDRNDFV